MLYKSATNAPLRMKVAIIHQNPIIDARSDSYSHFNGTKKYAIISVKITSRVIAMVFRTIMVVVVTFNSKQWSTLRSAAGKAQSEEMIFTPGIICGRKLSSYEYFETSTPDISSTMYVVSSDNLTKCLLYFPLSISQVTSS